MTFSGNQLGELGRSPAPISASNYHYSSSRAEEDGDATRPNKRPKLDCEDIADKVSCS
jgi:hypothetical protein